MNELLADGRWARYEGIWRRACIAMGLLWITTIVTFMGLFADARPAALLKATAPVEFYSAPSSFTLSDEFYESWGAPDRLRTTGMIAEVYRCGFKDFYAPFCVEVFLEGDMREDLQRATANARLDSNMIRLLVAVSVFWPVWLMLLPLAFRRMLVPVVLWIKHGSQKGRA